VREVLQQEEEKEKVTALIQPLKAVIADSRQIRELATNPLLCAMLCALNRDRNQQLPSDRIELYEACCVMLMERRDRERHIELADYPKLTLRQKRALLQDFAYWLLRNGWSEVKIEEADERFNGRLKNLAGLETTITGDAVRRLFIDRTGIVREPVVGKIDFTHRTFQEYLAAQAALEEGDIGVLINNAENDQWREAVILAVGQAGMRECSEIIQGLLDRGDKEKAHCHQLHLLAVACLETAVELEPVIKQAVQERLESLIPPKNMTEAKALASAGDLAIPYLVRKGRGLPTLCQP
jgi:predicted NACHT family NTPase